MRDGRSAGAGSEVVAARVGARPVAVSTTRVPTALGCCVMTDAWLSDTRSSYDTDAAGYAEKVRGLLDESPYLRASLALFAELVHGAGGGPVADVGCGPGYVTGYLHDAGVDVFGIDLSPEMIAIARRDYPDLASRLGR